MLFVLVLAADWFAIVGAHWIEIVVLMLRLTGDSWIFDREWLVVASGRVVAGRAAAGRAAAGRAVASGAGKDVVRVICLSR